LPNGIVIGTGEIKAKLLGGKRDQSPELGEIVRELQLGKGKDSEIPGERWRQY
jgi:hypothetical protein